MNPFIRYRRSLAALVLTMITAATFAPAAHADHGKYRRYRGPYYSQPVQRVVYTRPVYVHQSGAPVLAGLVGGLILGAAIANAAPAPCPPPHVYAYVDPYCGSRWATFDDCAAHLSYHPGPQLVQLVDVSTGACVNTWCWHQGGWQEWND